MIVVALIVGHRHPQKIFATSHTLFHLSLLFSLSPSKYMQYPSLHSPDSVEAHTRKRDWCRLFFLWRWRFSLDKDNLFGHEVDIVHTFVLVAL